MTLNSNIPVRVYYHLSARCVCAVLFLVTGELEFCWSEEIYELVWLTLAFFPRLATNFQEIVIHLPKVDSNVIVCICVYAKGCEGFYKGLL